MSSSELEVLDRLIAESRARLRSSADTVRSDVEEVTSVAAHVRRHPVISLAVGGGAGLGAGLLAGRALQTGAGSLRAGTRTAGRYAFRAARLLLVRSLVQAVDS